MQLALRDPSASGGTWTGFSTYCVVSVCVECFYFSTVRCLGYLGFARHKDNKGPPCFVSYSANPSMSCLA